MDSCKEKYPCPYHSRSVTSWYTTEGGEKVIRRIYCRNIKDYPTSEFDEFRANAHQLRDEVLQALCIPQIVDWIAKKLNK